MVSHATLDPPEMSVPAIPAIPTPTTEPRPVTGRAALRFRRFAGRLGLAGIWRCFWLSRLIVLAAGAAGVIVLGPAPDGIAGVDPTGLSRSFGAVGNILMAPAVRWDAVWYVQIAHSGYSAVQDTAFYPLYPLVVHAAAWLTGSLPLAGIGVSLLAMFVALIVVHRLAELELGSQAGDVAVRLVAFGPMAVFLSAVYTESLFLALSAGTLYAARRGRWPLAGVLGALGAATRVNGVALLVPVLIFFLYGPRDDLPPLRRRSGWRPRYALSPAVLWPCLIPVGSILFGVYLSTRSYDLTSTLHAQELGWDHRLTIPVITVWDGLRAAWQQLTVVVTGSDPALYLKQSMFQTVALVLAIAGLVGVLRRLPLAYGAYVIVGLLIALSTPTVGDPLKGLARYASLLLPLQMCAGAWALERSAHRTVVIGSAVLMVVFTVQFATWHMVGTPLI